MIDPLYEEFPEAVEADGNSYAVITDFREWVRFSDMINDSGLDPESKIIFLSNWLIEPPKIVTKAIVDAVFEFYKASALEPDPVEAEEHDGDDVPIRRPPTFDWKTDAVYIIADFQRYYGIDLLSCDMHWWRFRCLLIGLPDDSNVKKRISLRNRDPSQIKDNAERRRILEIQRKIAIPFEYDDNDVGEMFDM